MKSWTAGEFKGRPQELNLPSAPKQFITYFEEENRPQTKLDRDIERGMGVSVGRLREDSLYDYKFVGLSHNTARGWRSCSDRRTAESRRLHSSEIISILLKVKATARSRLLWSLFMVRTLTKFVLIVYSVIRASMQKQRSRKA